MYLLAAVLISASPPGN